MRVVFSQGTISRAPKQVVISLVVFVITLITGACQQPSSDLPELDGDLTTVGLHGRVVNFESCMHLDRCRNVEGVKVSLRQLPDSISSPTDFPGRFFLPVPPRHEDDLLVEPNELSFAPTINPWAAPAAVTDVYGIELFVMPVGNTDGGAPTLLEALANLSPPIQLLNEDTTVGQGGYLGQVLRIEEGDDHAVLGAAVTVTVPNDWPATVPEPEVRYVGSIPQYDSGEVLLEPGYPATGAPGVFVIATHQQSTYITIHVETADTVFTEIVAPVQPGTVTVGVHVP